MKSPPEYHSRDFQLRLLLDGTREQLIEWLVWNDPNGTYTDSDSAAEDLKALTLDRAREIMQEQIERA